MSQEIIAVIESAEQDVSCEEEVQVQEIEGDGQELGDDRNWEAPKLVQWNEEIALILVNIYKQYAQEFSSPFTKKKNVWQKIAQIMNNMHGFGVTASQCENKFKSMTVAYKKAIDNNKRSVASHNSYELFKELDDLYRHNPIVHHIGVASSSSGFQFNNNYDGRERNNNPPSKKRKIEKTPEWKRNKMTQQILQAISELDAAEQDTSMDEAQAEEIQTSDHANEESAYGAPKLVQWNEMSSIALLKIYKEHLQEFSSPFTKKKQVWKKIARIMNEEHGYGVTFHQCENKMKNLTLAYKKANESHRRSVASHNSHALYRELDDLFRHGPVVHHLGTASSTPKVEAIANNDYDYNESELMNLVKGNNKNKRKKFDHPPAWVCHALEGVQKRHQERMAKYDKLITILEKMTG